MNNAKNPVHTIDVNWMCHDYAIACYAIETSAGVVLIDPGPHSTHETLRDALEEKGIALADIRHIIATHIHLDHAGGAWWWAKHAGTKAHPTQVHVHHFGAGHLVDPSRLHASALRIYGDQMIPMWGDLQPIDESQVHVIHDNDVLTFGDVSLTALETPGHAAHHHAWETNINGEFVCFCGDAAAMTVYGHRFVSLPMPPPEYSLEQWLASLTRLKTRNYDAIYPTHFGRVDHVSQQLDDVAAALKKHTSFLIDLIDQGVPTETITTRYQAWLHDEAIAANLSEQEIPRLVSSSIVTMNIMGVTRYHAKRQQSTHASE